MKRKPTKPLIEIFQAKGAQKWRFHVRSKNGRILCQSEGYTTKQNAKKALVALGVILHGPLADYDQILENVTQQTRNTTL